MLSKNIALAWCNFKWPTPLKLDLDLTRGTSAEVARGAHYCSALTPLRLLSTQSPSLRPTKRSNRLKEVVFCGKKSLKEGGGEVTQLSKTLVFTNIAIYAFWIDFTNLTW